MKREWNYQDVRRYISRSRFNALSHTDARERVFSGEELLQAIEVAKSYLNQYLPVSERTGEILVEVWQEQEIPHAYKWSLSNKGGRWSIVDIDRYDVGKTRTRGSCSSWQTKMSEDDARRVYNNWVDNLPYGLWIHLKRK